MIKNIFEKYQLLLSHDLRLTQDEILSSAEASDALTLIAGVMEIYENKYKNLFEGYREMGSGEIAA